MQIFLWKSNMKFKPNEFTKITFDGTNLRTFLNKKEIDCKKAKVGECFIVEDLEAGKKPYVTKQKLPKTRGKKIAWVLGFDNEKKQAESLADYRKRIPSVLENADSELVLFSDKSSDYAFTVGKNYTKSILGKPESLLCWVSDTISSKKLDKLIRSLSRYQHFECPIEFIKTL